MKTHISVRIIFRSHGEKAIAYRVGRNTFAHYPFVPWALGSHSLLSERPSDADYERVCAALR